MRVVLLLLFVCNVSLSQAQDKVITIAPLGLVNKVRLKYEQSITGYLSGGTYANVYFASFKGLRFDPFLRLYPGGDAPDGFYIQVKGMAGLFSKNIEYVYEVNDSVVSSVEASHTWPCVGYGVGAGYQFMEAIGDMPLDLFLGLQYTKYMGPREYYYNNTLYQTYDDMEWYLTGPGSILNMNIGIGFSF